ncbi:hypothetical protein [Enterococcus termitis]|uniref:Uncharacterized protein n=1 Tax=Enterococcus termitis TaxID=332950 RepID=A0A1E5H5S2_9ENTE|nr:hypothetical protein [Enterococcus termitis]OEG20274.1 hypothetical protein BCR25_00135 [Enterococcus termitis]OJG97310.1 hypothetical protein RV18_GL000998 [Enterococcus termitis]
MIDQNYLNKFGENRYNQMISTSIITDEPLFEEYKDIIEMKFLKEMGGLASWSSIIYDLYYYLEMIQRIDFFSKYYFHALSPKARNISSVKLIFVHKTHLFVYDPLTDRIHVHEQNYFEGLDPEKDYLVILNDNRQLQRFYGDFSCMLGLLNTGHFLYNLEHVLQAHQIRTKEITQKISFSAPKEQVTIPYAIEIAADQEYHLCKEDIKQQAVSKEFMNRTSEQNIRGDAVTGVVLPSEVHTEIFKAFQSAADSYPGIKLWCFVDHVLDVESGFYQISQEVSLVKAESQSVYKELLQEYQDFTNLEGMNYWLFLTFEKNKQKYDQYFVQIGRIAQHLSVIAARYGLAARGMKNYNDLNVKKKFNLTDETIIGYSVNIFEALNTSHSLMLK